ncbi:MAG: hypothetical protein GF331_22005 [Chitinivibrionales bacterium]|nr:hypothetical protein [Chitinivibrionales bacterium]
MRTTCNQQCLRGREVLRSVGVDWKLAESLPDRGAALHTAQSLWLIARRGSKEAGEEWRRLEPRARQPRQRLLRACRYTSYDCPGLLRPLANVRRERNRNALIQHLRLLGEIGTQYSERLSGAGVNQSEIEGAISMADRLAELLPRMLLNQHNCEARRIRDRAYVHLYDAAAAVCRAAAFVYPDPFKRPPSYKLTRGTRQ